MKKMNPYKDKITVETNLKSNLSLNDLSKIFGEELIILIDEHSTKPINHLLDIVKKVN